MMLVHIHMANCRRILVFPFLPIMQLYQTVALLFVTISIPGGNAASKAVNNIPLAVNSDYRYEAKVNMSSTNPQTLKFELSSSTAYTVVAGSDCGNCTDVARYDRSQSQSASDLSKTASMSVPGGSASGKLIKESCVLHTTDGKGWTYDAQTVIVANQANNVFSGLSSGILGLGRNARAKDFSVTLYYPWFVRNPDKQEFSIGMALNHPYDTSQDGGLLHWLHVDSGSYKGELIRVNTTDNQESDWVIPVEGWSLGVGVDGPLAFDVNTSFLAVLDPYEPDIYLPMVMADLIYSKVVGSSRESNPSGLGYLWTVPCDSKIRFSVKMAGTTFPITEKQIVRRGPDRCYSTLRGWANDQNTGSALLGSSFISANYVVYTIDRQGNGAVQFGNRGNGSSKAVSAGAIAGIVIGSVALLLSIAIIVTWLVRRRIRKVKLENRTTAAEPYTETKSTPESAPNSLPPSSSAYITEFDHGRINARSWAGTSMSTQAVELAYHPEAAPPEYSPHTPTSVASPRSVSYIESVSANGK